jgi:hypothetical protein
MNKKILKKIFIFLVLRSTSALFFATKSLTIWEFFLSVRTMPHAAVTDSVTLTTIGNACLAAEQEQTLFVGLVRA